MASYAASVPFFARSAKNESLHLEQQRYRVPTISKKKTNQQRTLLAAKRSDIKYGQYVQYAITIRTFSKRYLLGIYLTASRGWWANAANRVRVCEDQSTNRTNQKHATQPFLRHSTRAQNEKKTEKEKKNTDASHLPPLCTTHLENSSQRLRVRDFLDRLRLPLPLLGRRAEGGVFGVTFGSNADTVGRLAGWLVGLDGISIVHRAPSLNEHKTGR